MFSAIRQRLATLLDLEAASEHDCVPRGRIFKLRIAATPEERRAAATLVNRRYTDKGYEAEVCLDGAEDQMTFVALADGKTLATLTVRFDCGESGLLADGLYADELDRLRDDDRRLCEVTKFAADESVRSRRVLASLFHVAYVHARRIRHCTDVVAEVNPSHARFYESLLGFVRVGPVRVNRRVNAPAVLLSMTLAEIEERIASLPSVAAVQTSTSLYPHGLSPKEERLVVARLEEVRIG